MHTTNCVCNHSLLLSNLYTGKVFLMCLFAHTTSCCLLRRHCHFHWPVSRKEFHLTKETPSHFALPLSLPPCHSPNLSSGLKNAATLPQRRLLARSQSGGIPSSGRAATGTCLLACAPARARVFEGEKRAQRQKCGAKTTMIWRRVSQLSGKNPLSKSANLRQETPKDA